MKRLIVLVVVCFVFISAASAVTFTDKDRILILAPHPDDEVLGCGGIIQEALRRNLPVREVFLTYGDNYEWAFLVYKKRPVLASSAIRKMGWQRSEEALAAGEVLGMKAENITFLGYPDWGTEKIWMSHWGLHRPPLRSMLTRVTAVPYRNAFRPGAAYKGEEILDDLQAIIQNFRPTKVFVSHPSDAHRDHRALFLYTRIALWNLEGEMKPEIFPYLIHQAKWPKPRGLKWDRQLTPPTTLNDVTWTAYDLNPEQTKNKQRALKAHKTQMAKDAAYLNSFVATNELFGAPEEIQLSSIQEITNPASEEEAEAVDMKWRAIWREKDMLKIRLLFSKSFFNLKKRTNIYLFGYHPDQPFAESPKIRFAISRKDVKGFNQLKPIDLSMVQIEWEKREMTLTVPLALLGNPKKIFGNVWSRTAEEPYDRQAWRIIDLDR